MNPYAFLSLASLLINLVLAGYILSKNPRGPAARIYVVLLVAFSIWGIPEIIIRAFPGGNLEMLLLLIKVEWIGISFIPGVMAHFVLAYPRRSRFLDHPWSLLVLYTPSIVFTSFLWAGDLLVKDVVLGPLGYSALVGILYLPLASLYAVIIILALGYLGRAYIHAEDHRSRVRYALILAGFAIPTLAGTITEVFGPFLFQAGTRLGLGTVYTTIFASFIAYAVFRYAFLVIEPGMEVSAVGRRFGWEGGRNYLVLERGRKNSFMAFRELVQETPGLCVTAFPPQMLAEEFSLHRIPFLWLTSQEGYRWSLKPTLLEVDVLQTVLKFMRDNRGSVLLLDDLEYLSEVNGFKPVLRFVSKLVATASKYGCTLITDLNPRAVGGHQLAMMKGLFDEVVPLSNGDLPAPPMVPSTSILWEGERGECFKTISKATISRKILVSSLFPEKLESAYGLHDATFLWIAPTSHPEFSTYDASRLSFEVLRDVSKALSEETLVYLGELELLVEQTSFLNVLEYVKHLIDATISRTGVVVATARRDSIPESQLSVLEKRFATRVL